MQTIKAKEIKIRYNTDSDGKVLPWRLLVDGKELLVNHMDINCPSKTTTDWLKDKQAYKHHISVENCLLIINTDTMRVTIQASGI